VPCR